jgi:hypothetical protein
LVGFLEEGNEELWGLKHWRLKNRVQETLVVQNSFCGLKLWQLFSCFVWKGRDLSLGVGAQEIVSQSIEVRVKTSHRPLQRIGFNGDHLRLAAHKAGDLRSNKLVEGADDACGSWGSRENCIFRNFCLSSADHRGTASSVHCFVEHSRSASVESLAATGVVKLSVGCFFFEFCYNFLKLFASEEVDVWRGI